MTSEEKRINHAFWSVADGNFSEKDKSALLEHKNDIYTCDLTENAINGLTKGRNGFSIFADSSKSWRQESYRKGHDFTVQGTLGDILAYVAEMSDIKLPKELQHESPGRNLEFFNIRDLCNKLGDFHEIIQDRYLYDGSAITVDDVEEHRASGKDIAISVLDLVNAERKNLVYNHREMQQRLDDSLDLEKAFTVEPKSVGIRATIEANKEKATAKESLEPSKEHSIGDAR